MSLFKRKKIYRVEWSYENYSFYYTEFVKARTWFDAWQKVRKQHFLPIVARKIEEVDG